VVSVAASVKLFYILIILIGCYVFLGNSDWLLSCDRKQTADGVDTDSEWLRLLTEQQRLQQVEVQRWRHVLVSSIQIVEQMEDALRNLHDGVIQRSDDIVALIEKAKLSATAHVADSSNAAHITEDSTSTNSTASSPDESIPA
jgi:hypothetical protein